MSRAVVIDNQANTINTIELPKEFGEINSHNFYLQVKAYLAAARANTARAKTRAQINGSGKKPWAQKGRGTARSGSRTSPIWVGGGKAFGSTKRNYLQKVNKKQRKLAFDFALNQKANNGHLFVIENLKIESGKTKDAQRFIANFKDAKDVLIVVDFHTIDEKTFLACRNLSNAYMVDSKELNVYLLSAYHSVIIQNEVFENLTKGS